MKLALEYVRRHLGIYLAAVFFLVLECVCDLALPALMADMVDKGVEYGDVQAILSLGGAMLLATAVGAASMVLRNNLAGRASQLIGHEMRTEIYRKVQELSFENVDRLQPASIVTRLTNDVTTVVNFINATMRIAVRTPVLLVGSAVMIYRETPQFAPQLAVVVVAVGALMAANMWLSRPRYQRLQESIDGLNGVSREFLSSVRLVKAFGAEGQESTRFNAAAREYADASIHAMSLGAVFSPLIHLVVNLGTVALLWASRAADPGEIGRVMASLNYMAQVLSSLGMMNIIVNAAMRASVSAARIREVLDERPAQAWPSNPAPFALQGALAFEGVSFTYADTQRPALVDVSFALEPGQTLGVIGPTGSGKTTLTGLIPRFYDAEEGRVLLDGRDVRSISAADLCAQVAVVPQVSTLFTGTIEENLRWGDADATSEELAEAAETAQAHGFVEGFPQGYATQLGQGGVNLSGGQRQRLALARALVRRPRLLVLDDCTSALDASTEAAVLANLRERCGQTTVVLVSQRVSTVRRADLVLCLEDGRVQGLGTHEELLASCPTYQAICASQMGDEAHG